MTGQQTRSTALTADVVVIGGGLHGCSTALHLAMAGMSVVVLEKDYVGRHASGVNAGGVRRLGRDLAEIPLSVASAKMWDNIEDLVDDDCGFSTSHQIKVAETTQELNQLQARVEQVRQSGFEHEQIIDQQTLQQLLPNAASHCVGGIIVEGDGHANPFRTVHAFKRKCQSLGVKFLEETSVAGLEFNKGIWSLQCFNNGNRKAVQALYIVNCAGAWGGKIAAMLGETVPVKACAPMLMITARMPPFVEGVVGAQGRTLSFKQFSNGTVLIGGGHQGVADPDTNTTLLDYKKLAINAQTATAIFPVMRKARLVRAWAGIEGIMADGIPVIGPSQAEGVFHGFGFSAHGFQLGPIGGKILSDLVITGYTDLPISPFRVDRFS